MNLSFKRLWGLAVCAAALASTAEAGEYLVQLRPGASVQGLLASFRAKGVQRLRGSYSGSFEVLSIRGSGRTSEAARLRQLKKDPDVLSVTPNFSMHSASEVPDDPYYPYQWNFYQLQMETVWGTDNADGRNVLVAILDTGVAYENWGGYVMPAHLSTTNFVVGWDFVNNDTHANDDNGHGTHMAAIIVERTDNNAGAAAMAPKARILPVKVLDRNGQGTLEHLINGIDYAVQRGARVINMSLNLPPGTPSIQLLEESLAKAHNLGVVLVGAAGNDGLPNVSLPAASNYVIAVGASNRDLLKASYSNYGQALDILAPGGDTLDRNGDGKPDAILQVASAPSSPNVFRHYFGVGTSQAAAHVSAAAAILWNRSGVGTSSPVSARPLKIRGLLQKYAKNGGNWNAQTGYGVIQVADAWSKPIPTTSLSGWQGYVTTPATVYPQGVFAVIYSHPVNGLLAFLETPQEGVFALYQGTQGGNVLVFDVPDVDLQDIYGNGVATFLSSRGGVEGLWSTASLTGQVQAPSGLLGLLDASGLLEDLLIRYNGASAPVTFLWSDGTGSAVQRILDSGGLMSLLNTSGGLMSLLNTSGGLMSLLNTSGGMMSLLNTSGGMMSLLNTSGEPLGLLSGSTGDGVCILSNGLLDPPLP